MTVDVNLFGEHGADVRTNLLQTSDGLRFLSLRVGDLCVILNGAAQARQIAEALMDAARELDPPATSTRYRVTHHSTVGQCSYENVVEARSMEEAIQIRNDYLKIAADDPSYLVSAVPL